MPSLQEQPTPTTKTSYRILRRLPSSEHFWLHDEVSDIARAQAVAGRLRTDGYVAQLFRVESTHTLLETYLPLAVTA